MATIALYANKINNMSSVLSTVKSAFSATNSNCNLPPTFIRSVWRNFTWVWEFYKFAFCVCNSDVILVEGMLANGKVIS